VTKQHLGYDLKWNTIATSECRQVSSQIVGVKLYAYPLTRGINHGSTTSIGEIEDPIFLLRPSFFSQAAE